MRKEVYWANESPELDIIETGLGYYEEYPIEPVSIFNYRPITAATVESCVLIWSDAADLSIKGSRYEYLTSDVKELLRDRKLNCTELAATTIIITDKLPACLNGIPVLSVTSGSFELVFSAAGIITLD